MPDSRERFSWRRVFVAGSRAFAINFMLVMGLHVLPPVAFICPLGTGFVTGWNLTASRVEGLLIGLIMGIWMWLLCGVVGLGVMALGPALPMGLQAPDVFGVLLVATVLVGHLAIFAGAGAMLGGHFARKERASAMVAG